MILGNGVSSGTERNVSGCPKNKPYIPNGYTTRRRGSHRVMRHPTKRGIVVVAGNLNADMKAGTLSQVLKQAGLK